jgi:hypothetical protein
MSFGLKNDGATYQRAMDSIFHDFIDTIKGQVMAGFIADHSVIEIPQSYVDIEPWTLYFDGFKHKHGT